MLRLEITPKEAAVNYILVSTTSVLAGFRRILANLYLNGPLESLMISSAAHPGSRYSDTSFVPDQNGVFIPEGATTSTFPIPGSIDNEAPSIPRPALVAVYIGSSSRGVYWELEVTSMTFKGFPGLFFR